MTLQKISVSADYCFGDNPIQFSNLAKVNFVYAPNGSGKTTISNALAQQPSDVKNRLKWPIAQTDLLIRVFNEAYRTSMLTEHVDGIFTIGEESSQANGEIAALEEGRKVRRQERDHWIREIGSEESGIDEKGLKPEILKEKIIAKNSVFDLHRTVPEELRATVFKGFRNDKEKFFIEACKRHESSLEIPADLDWVRLEERRSALSGDLSERSILPVHTLNTMLQIDEVDMLRRDESFGVEGDFASFIQHLGIADWVNEGREHITDESDCCPFCQQVLPKGFISKLSGFFAGGYDEALENARHLSSKVASRIKLVNEYLTDLENAIQRDELIEAETFSDAVKALKVGMELVESQVAEKLRHPASPVEVESVDLLLTKLNEIVVAENTLINKHNRLVQNASSELLNLVDQGWALFLKIAGVSNVLRRYIAQRDRKQARIDELSEKINVSDQDESKDIEAIGSLKNSISNTTAVADRINQLLRALGFTRFSLSPAGGVAGGYRILRSDGSLAVESLSEGERSFLCFAYYLESLSGSLVRGNAAESVIAVIDDPISSLDSDTLFIVAAYIRDLAKKVIEGDSNVVQLIVLTHNTQFHHEAAYTVNDAKGGDRCHYRMHKGFDGPTTLRNDGSRSMIRGSYDMLWQAIVDIACDENESSTSQVGVFNIARRIVEGYFKTVGLPREIERDKALSVLEERLISMFHIWASSGSHTIVDGFAQSHDVGGTRRFLQLLQFFFDQQGHSAHFDMMIRASGGSELLEENSIFGGSLV